MKMTIIDSVATAAWTLMVTSGGIDNRRGGGGRRLMGSVVAWRQA